jgi:hypothetical protein
MHLLGAYVRFVHEACHTRHADLAPVLACSTALGGRTRRRKQDDDLNTRRNSANNTIPSDTPPGWLPDANIAGQAIYDGNARRSGTREWPRGLARPRHTGSAKGCHREGVLPQNGARGGQRRAATPCCSDAGSDGGVMARRAFLDRGTGRPRTAGELRRPARMASGPSAPRHWRGSGRWLVWAFRAVAWAVLLVIGYRGVTAIVNPPQQAGAVSGTAERPRNRVPNRMAEAYARSSPGVPASARRRRRRSAAACHLPGRIRPSLGWDGSGSCGCVAAQVVGITVRDSQHAVGTCWCGPAAS